MTDGPTLRRMLSIDAAHLGAGVAYGLYSERYARHRMASLADQTAHLHGYDGGMQLDMATQLLNAAIHHYTTLADRMWTALWRAAQSARRNGEDISDAVQRAADRFGDHCPPAYITMIIEDAS